MFYKFDIILHYVKTTAIESELMFLFLTNQIRADILVLGPGLILNLSTSEIRVMLVP